MMKTYRRNPARARLGSLIAAGMVGGGLMLTASNGIAAETGRQVEAQVRTALAPVVPAVAPAPLPPAPPAPVAAPPAPNAPHPVVRVERHVKPNGRVVTVVETDRDAIVDGAAIEREVAQAVREAQIEARLEAAQEAREARREAMDASRQAIAEARAAAAEATAAARVHAMPVSVTGACAKAEGVSVRVDDSGHRNVTCYKWTEADRAKMRQQMLASLEQARRSVAASMDHDWGQRAREHALASIDRQIARLKAEK